MSSQRQHNHYPLSLTPPEALVIHCSDYRFQAAIRTFVQSITTQPFDLLAIPGGPHLAAAGTLLPEYHMIVKQNVALLVELHQLTRLILIDHTDCAFFQRRLSLFYAGDSPDQQQMVSLKQSRAVVEQWFPALGVDAYFAERVSEQGVRFQLA